MARVKLKFPANNPLYTVKIPLRIGDMNYGNHLGNDRLLGILQEARVQWLQSAGFSELDVGGCGLIMADAMIAYKGEGFYGDVLEIHLYCGAQQLSSFELLFRVETERSGKKIAIAEAKTGMAGFDYAARRVCPLPSAFVRCLQPTEGAGDPT